MKFDFMETRNKSSKTQWTLENISDEQMFARQMLISSAIEMTKDEIETMWANSEPKEKCMVDLELFSNGVKLNLDFIISAMTKRIDLIVKNEIEKATEESKHKAKMYDKILNIIENNEFKDE